jgi:hypothetical protein
MTELLRPDRAALLRWLTSPAVVRPNGEVMSWVGPGAFAYPEAGGFLLALLTLEGSAHGCAQSIDHWLARCVRDDAIRREGRRHAFDLGIVGRGLLAWASAHLLPLETKDVDSEQAEAAIAHYRALEAMNAIWLLVDDIVRGRGHDGLATGRWSGEFGPHLRKAGFVLRELRENIPPFESACEELWHRTGGDGFDPRAPTPGASSTYLHACAYALEGTVTLAPLYGDDDCVYDALEWFARLQRADGGMPAWADGERGFGPTRADATAQAVRLWAWLDPHRWAESIARGLDWLARATVPGGGVRYADDCDHQNTWATVFAIQALDFADGRGSGDTLV